MNKTFQAVALHRKGFANENAADKILTGSFTLFYLASQM